MDPLPRIEDYVRRPGFRPVCPPTRFKQTDQVIPRANYPRILKIGPSLAQQWSAPYSGQGARRRYSNTR